MVHLQQAISSEFLESLAQSTADGIDRRDCFFNQLHYVNRGFVAEHFEELAGLVVRAVAIRHPGLTIRDLTYVNDFVAPVNLRNARIHNYAGNNKYGWHTDEIDRFLRPCYNLWIPLYRSSALTRLDERSLFDVITPESCAQIYAAQGEPRQGVLWTADQLSAPQRRIRAKFVDVPLEDLDRYLYFTFDGKTSTIVRDEATPASVVRPRLGDCYVFRSSFYHASGPSDFERVGISIKFLVHNPELGFRAMPHSRLPSGWAGMFLAWYGKQRKFSAYEEIVPSFIEGERPALDRNADKLSSVCEVLREICNELGSERRPAISRVGAP